MKRGKGPKKLQEKLAAIAAEKEKKQNEKNSEDRRIALQDRLIELNCDIRMTDVPYHWEIPGEVEKLRRLKKEREIVLEELNKLSRAVIASIIVD